MNKIFTGILMALALLLAAGAGPLDAQGTAFTYQGRLSASGAPAQGDYDFRFLLYDNSTGGTQQGGANDIDAVPVTNGLFTVTLDFGAVLNGSARWLDIYVRINGSTNFIELSPRQNATPAPYAVYAGNAGSAATSAGFSGSLAGNVTGSQGATVASSVGGQSAANVASATVAANGASSVNFANSIVKRDASGNFRAGVVTAANFVGGGAGLTSLTASNVTSGTLPVAVLPASVAQLGANQTFTGNNTFSNGVVFSPGNGNLSVINDQGIVPGLVATGGGAPGHARFRNALEIWPDAALINSGYLDVRNTSQNPTILLNGQAGSVTAASLSGDGSSVAGVSLSALGGTELNVTNGQPGLSVHTNIYLNDTPIYLRGDPNHGLAYNGNGVTNFPSGAVLPDGPVLWGYTGGALGLTEGGPQVSLAWDNSGVTVTNELNIGGSMSVAGNLNVADLRAYGNITAINTGGLNWSQQNESTITTVNAGTSATIATMGNAKPAPGYFVVTATANLATGNTQYQLDNIYLELFDVSSGTPVLLDQVDYFPYGNAAVTAGLTWVVPITQAGGYQNFSLVVVAPYYASAVTVGTRNLTAMYFPRLNN